MIHRRDHINSAHSLPEYQVAYHLVKTPRYFTILLGLYATLIGPYLVWRLSIVNWHSWIGPVVMLAELYSLFMTASSLWITHRLYVPVFRLPQAIRVVDALVPTYNEPVSILEP